MERLLQDPVLNLVRFCTTTSRPPREDEQNDIHYQFVSPEEFQKMVAANTFFEWTEIYGYSYGSNKETLKALRAGTRPIICVLEPEGARKIKAADPEHTTIILIEATREDLLGRLKQRHTNEADIKKRIERIDRELRVYPLLADVVVENNDGMLDTAISKVASWIKNMVQQKSTDI